MGIKYFKNSLGIILLAHGWLKISVFTIAGTVDYFASLGLPSFFAYLVIFGEIIGGITLILGIQTRLTALFCLPILIGATFVHLNNGWLFSAEGGGWEFPVSLSIIALAIIFMGSGNRINLKFNPLNTFLPTQLQN